MSILRIAAAGAVFVTLSACESDNTGDKTIDRGLIGRSSLQDLSPGIWVDPRGCEPVSYTHLTLPTNREV